jgi:SAM-dependent methyltransferase
MTENMTSTNNTTSFSFRCPVHQSPGAIAHSFNYEPYISLKIDGIFQKVSPINHNNFYPVFPITWTKIEGECYQVDNKPPILYVFYIESSEQSFSNLAEMYKEIKTYFLDNTNTDTDSDEIADLDDKSSINEDMIHNIRESFKWRDSNTVSPRGLIWFPKKYWKLDVSCWNTYIDQLDDLFNFVNTNDMRSIVSHDGLVISPNIPTQKKSLVKLKPKEDLTIDLFFNGRKFFSNERTDYSAIIDNYRASDYDYGSVYRLVPNANNKFIPAYKREPTKKPNPDNIIGDIIFKLNNYFEISQLKDLYETPWYGDLINSGLSEMRPVFEYTQQIYNSVLSQMNRGTVLDIGCGSMGQYHKHFISGVTTQYVGLDLDLAKLHESQVKVKYDSRFKFVLGDISYRWNKFNERFNHNIWNTYYYNMVKLNQRFDNIISVFSSQYANTNSETWANYIGEINFRSKPGTRLFIMWIDSSKIVDTTKSRFYSSDPESNILNINLPHRPPHSEPKLGSIIDYFIGSESNPLNPKKKWVIDRTINIDVPPINHEFEISQYMNLINWTVFVKI